MKFKVRFLNCGLGIPPAIYEEEIDVNRLVSVQAFAQRLNTDGGFMSHTAPFDGHWIMPGGILSVRQA